jgi:hypothetical protein
VFYGFESRRSPVVSQTSTEDKASRRRNESAQREITLLIQAITYPARWLDKRGVFLPGQDYRAILDAIISGIKQHGNTRSVRYFGSYFLDCVQRHIKHHEEAYYDHAKGLQAKASLAMRDIINGVHVDDDSETGSTTDLAALNKLLKSPGGRRRGRLEKPS